MALHLDELVKNGPKTWTRLDQLCPATGPDASELLPQLVPQAPDPQDFARRAAGVGSGESTQFATLRHFEYTAYQGIFAQFAIGLAGANYESVLREFAAFHDFARMWTDTMLRTEAAIAELGGKPDDPRFGERTPGEIIRDATTLRRLRERYSNRYGLTVIVRPERQRRRRQPDRDMDEVIEIVQDFRKWEARGWTQQQYCDSQGWASRTILTNALARYRAESGEN
jgi:hypothetical protein